jgi:hypothetical protein
MPTPYIKKLSREGKGSVPSLEKKWDKAKEAAGKQGHAKDYGYVTNIFKKMSHASLQLQAAQRLRASDPFVASLITAAASQEDVFEAGLEKYGVKYERKGSVFKIGPEFKSKVSNLASLLRRIVEHFDTVKDGCYLDSTRTGANSTIHLWSQESEWLVDEHPDDITIERLR